MPNDRGNAPTVAECKRRLREAGVANRIRARTRRFGNYVSVWITVHNWDPGRDVSKQEMMAALPSNVSLVCLVEGEW